MNKYKNVLMVCVLTLMLLFSLSACGIIKNPTGPDDPDDPPDTGATFEILYERVLAIVDPNGYDPHTEPAGGTAGIFHPTYGGQNSSYWVMVEKNKKWQAEANLQYDTQTSYTIHLHDRKVEDPISECIARDIYMRKKGQTQWKKLDYVRKRSGFLGEEAVFLVDSTGVHNPS